jgi:hypothetical protein
MEWVLETTLNHVPISNESQSDGIYIRKEFAEIIKKDKRIQQGSGKTTEMIANK